MGAPNGHRAGPGLPRVHGHAELLDRIRRAVENRRMPQSLLLHGGEGVGKRTFALTPSRRLIPSESQRPIPACGTATHCGASAFAGGCAASDRASASASGSSRFP